MEEEGDYIIYTYPYTVTTGLIPALRRAAMGAIFNASVGSDGQNHKTVGSDGRGEGGMQVGGEGDYIIYTYRFTVTTRMTSASALRRAAMRAVLMFQ